MNLISIIGFLVFNWELGPKMSSLAYGLWVTKFANPKIVQLHGSGVQMIYQRYLWESKHFEEKLSIPVLFE